MKSSDDKPEDDTFSDYSAEEVAKAVESVMRRVNDEGTRLIEELGPGTETERTAMAFMMGIFFAMGRQVSLGLVCAARTMETVDLVARTLEMAPEEEKEIVALVSRGFRSSFERLGRTPAEMVLTLFRQGEADRASTSH